MKIFNIKLTLSYEGTEYSGFQSQKNNNTVANEIKKALYTITGIEDPKIYCAGRTDTGVHALGQTVNFYTDKSNLTDNNWIMALNSYLPHDIRILKCEFMPDDFNSRRSAHAREYWYRLYNGSAISAIDYRFCGHYIQPLDIDLLKGYSYYIIGEHDFSSFCSSKDSNRSRIRNIHSVTIDKTDDMIVFKIIGNAFLHKMIRTIIGTMLMLHKRGKPAEEMKKIIESKNRYAAGATFSPKGLVFYKVHYDDGYIKK